MIKQKTKSKKRKNPELQEKANEIFEFINPSFWRYLTEGDYAEIYKFGISQNTRIPFVKENVILKPGTYCLKILKNSDKNLDLKSRNFLKKLSKHKLIPEIFLITNNIIIMEYIDGDTLLNLMEEIPPGILERIFLDLYKIIERYHDLGYSHSDLHLKNILIDENNKVHVIDPLICKKDFEKDNELLNHYYIEYVGYL